MKPVTAKTVKKRLPVAAVMLAAMTPLVRAGDLSRDKPRSDLAVVDMRGQLQNRSLTGALRL